MSLDLGCIADDFTGATDLALTLCHEGMRAVQLIGVPDVDAELPDADALVIALKSRTMEPAQAVQLSLSAQRRLLAAGAQQIYFKYCSTFDSTDQGNIGNVTEALMRDLGGGITVACPAFPANGRTVYQGHLFVKGELLSDSPMRDHPLTPMRDANLVRLLQRQTRLKVGLIDFDTVRLGADAIRERLAELQSGGVGIAIVDALTDDNLRQIGHACDGLKLVTGASGLGLGIPANFHHKPEVRPQRLATRWCPLDGGSAVIAGSCSTATRAQVAHARSRMPTHRIDPLALAEGDPVVEQALAWAEGQDKRAGILLYSSDDPAEVAALQQKYGRMDLGARIESAMGLLAQGLVNQGVRRLVVAGGETSGAVVEALSIKALAIGPEIDPGVPWTRSIGGRELCLALKSGNFGSEDFFIKALEMLA